MEAYLFVHFREKETPDGEQVYFALSLDGFHWEAVNRGEPVLWSTKGDKGVRDHAIIRTRQGKFYILATDLSLANCFKTKYKGNWNNISRYGSKFLCLWESEDLVNWSEQRMLKLGDDNYGCLWAPDVIYDSAMDDYILHWTSSHLSNNFGDKAIYYSRTKNFKVFSNPVLMYRKDDSGIIDSAIYEEGGIYYHFLKSEKNPSGIIMRQSETPISEHSRITEFDREMLKLDGSLYEAPTAFELNDGSWCLMLDYFGISGEGQGYVPFIAKNLSSGQFIRSDESFSFPYGFKHGTVLPITMEEYIRISTFEFNK
jgi:Beta-xylosidase